MVAIPSSVFYDHPAGGRTQVRFAFCKKDDVLREAMARLARNHGWRNGCAAPDDLFGADLYGAGGTGNMVFSPASIAAALGMALLGARGDTAAQLAAALHLASRQERGGRPARDLRPAGQPGRR